MKFMTSFAKKGVRTTLQKTRTLLSVGIALSLASTSYAGTRSRTTDGRDQARTSADAPAATTEKPTFEEVAPGVGRGVINGFTVLVNADGRVVKEDEISRHGSVEDYMYVTNMMHVMKGTTPDGDTMYENGALFPRRDHYGSNAPEIAPRSLEDAKEVFSWQSRTVDGQEHMVFYNNIVTPDMPQARVVRGLSVTGPDGSQLRPDGSVYNR